MPTTHIRLRALRDASSQADLQAARCHSILTGRPIWQTGKLNDLAGLKVGTCFKVRMGGVFKKKKK